MELRVEHVTKKIKGRTILSDVCLCLTEGRNLWVRRPERFRKTMLFRAVSGADEADLRPGGSGRKGAA